MNYHEIALQALTLAKRAEKLAKGLRAKHDRAQAKQNQKKAA
ncbi:MAG: hypothetical protein ABW078_08945 [Sedimenticola sp.]